jgi:hypothetical protein
MDYKNYFFFRRVRKTERFVYGAGNDTRCLAQALFQFIRLRI